MTAVNVIKVTLQNIMNAGNNKIQMYAVQTAIVIAVNVFVKMDFQGTFAKTVVKTPLAKIQKTTLFVIIEENVTVQMEVAEFASVILAMPESIVNVNLMIVKLAMVGEVMARTCVGAKEIVSVRKFLKI